jgi:hypothetical protein
MDLDPLAMVPEVDLDLLAVVALGVVADAVDLAVPAQPAPQIPVRPEQCRVCLGLPSVRSTWPLRQGIEPERYRLSLFPGVSTGAWQPWNIPIEPIWGLVWMATASWKTAVSSSGSSASSFRHSASLA